MSTQTFNFSNSCDLEVHTSPFGISGIYIKVENSDSVGIGSTMGRLTGHTSGKLHYNKNEDLVNTKFKLYGLIEDKDILRIDFVKILDPRNGTNNEGDKTNDGKKEGEVKKEEDSDEKPTEVKSENPGDEGYEVPDLVFRGKAPVGRPDVVEPFIGIFSFEKSS
ncbi:hypothetical protein BN7_5126 [Wickerhamomyces ciferrii]|uniref:Uncharacterized protein n=1 Tax=Wickerhamomyces ciferrii (strain ATCC 14091 / BCRC 22168 / CBS 111 / JCM 3599 / NBRC 0793 / NRRL Y-1031 F-60-10) TaxID=1206466 RepID=K0KVN4_WICCF|nr:uncharacterized protein BN7_5126 [Wickerhamomyces ciferrii]CCH45544.1 hypothetical protein BN7_5126 [Wickerhamomyces ciferrii]